MTTALPHRAPPLRLLAAALVAALVLVACGSSSEGTVRLGDGTIAVDGGDDVATAPTLADAEPVQFRYDTFDGSTALFTDLTTGPVVVNFFASWCPTCIAEMPDFEKVNQALGDDVTFLGLALQDRPESALALVDDTGVTYAVGIDDGDIFEQFGGLGMPTTVFIGADGMVRDVHSGVLSDESLTDIIETELLGGA